MTLKRRNVVQTVSGILGGVAIGWAFGWLTRFPASSEITVTTHDEKIMTVTITEVVSTTKTFTMFTEKTVTLEKTESYRPISTRFPFSGVNLVWWPTDYEFNSSAKVIDYVAALPSNYLMLLLRLNQKSRNSSDIGVGYDIQRIRRLTEYALQRGMKVAWTPFLMVDDGSWRGSIEPSNPLRWFESYKDNLKLIASEASYSGVELLLIGTELESMTIPEYNQEWYSIVDAVKQHYRGPLCYGVNWWFNEEKFRNVLSLQWLSGLDYIGVNAYFELSPKNDPTLGELVDAWSNSERGVNPHSRILSDLYALHKTFGKPLIFTEIGYRSVNGSSKQPWNSGTIPDSDNNYDPEEQASCFEALFRVFAEQSWWRGCFIWGYESELAVKKEDKTYTPLGKPAENVIRKWFQR